MKRITARRAKSLSRDATSHSLASLRRRVDRAITAAAMLGDKTVSISEARSWPDEAVRKLLASLESDGFRVSVGWDDQCDPHLSRMRFEVSW